MKAVKRNIILSLCDKTGIWSKPYEDAEDEHGNKLYEVIRFDIQRCSSEDITKIDWTSLRGRVVGVIMQPPCTQFASSGARWWKGKDPALLEEALRLVWHCMRCVSEVEPDWYVMENPVGRLLHFIGEWTMNYQPHMYAGWLTGDAAQEERYTKRTCLWGNFTHPRKLDLGDLHGSKMHLLSPGPERANLRSMTPQGFAAAFFAANP